MMSQELADAVYKGVSIAVSLYLWPFQIGLALLEPAYLSLHALWLIGQVLWLLCRLLIKHLRGCCRLLIRRLCRCMKRVYRWIAPEQRIPL